MMRFRPGRWWYSDLAQTAMAFALRIASGLAGYGLFALAARVLGAENFGIFSLYFSAAMLAGALGSFGQQIFLVKEVPLRRVNGDLAGEFGAFKFAAISSVVAGTVVSAGLLVVGMLGGWDTSPSLMASTFLLTWLYGASQTTIGMLRVEGKTLLAMGTRDLLWRASSMTFMALAAGVLGWSSGRVSAGIVIGIMAVTLLPVVILHVVLAARVLGVRFRGVRAQLYPSLWIGTGLGLSLIALISSADMYVFTIVLSALLDEKATGAFFAAFKTVDLINLFLMAVTLVVSPEISRLVARGDRLALQRKANAATLLQAVPAILTGLILILAAPLFMWAFAAEYIPYANVLRVLMLGMLINVLTGATALLLQLAGMHWLQIGMQGGALLIAVLCTPTLVKWLGVDGAGIAFIMSKGLWNIAAIVVIRRRLRVDPSLLGLGVRGAGGLRGAVDDLITQFRG